MRTYLAGPMTGYESFNYPLFHAVAERLEQLGATVVSPAHDDDGVPLTPPEVGRELSRGVYMRRALAKLVTCDRIAMLPGWHESEGAKVEFQVAQALEMPCGYLSVGELWEWGITPGKKLG